MARTIDLDIELPVIVTPSEPQVQADWNQNDDTQPDFINNRICYEIGRAYKTSDTDKEVYEEEYAYYKQSVNISDFNGRDFYYKFSEEFEKNEGWLNNVSFVEESENVYIIDLDSDDIFYGWFDPVILITSDNTEYNDNVFDAGVYFVTTSDSGELSYYLSPKELKKIDEKYLPEASEYKDISKEIVDHTTIYEYNDKTYFFGSTGSYIEYEFYKKPKSIKIEVDISNRNHYEYVEDIDDYIVVTDESVEPNWKTFEILLSYSYDHYSAYGYGEGPGSVINDLYIDYAEAWTYYDSERTTGDLSIDWVNETYEDTVYEFKLYISEYYEIDRIHIPSSIATVEFVEGEFDRTTSNRLRNGSGIDAIAGSGTTASGQKSFAFGNYQVAATGSYCVAFNEAAKASGQGSVAIGSYVTASGQSSFATNYGSQATNKYSSAFGNSAKASGESSLACGRATEANHKSQFTFGEYNVKDPSAAASSDRGDYVEIVGNGTSASSRSNARTLDWSGNEQIAGTLRIGSTTTGGVLLKEDSGSLKISFDNGATWLTVQAS